MYSKYLRPLQVLCFLVFCAVMSPNFGVSQQGCAGASCDSQGLGDGSVIRIGYSQFTPYSGTSNAGVAEGYLIDLMRLLLEPLGYTLQFMPHKNPSELLKSLEAGRIDATTPLSINPDRKTYGTFAQPVHTFSFGVFVRRGDRELLEKTDLVGLRVGASQGSQADRLLRQIEGAIAVPFNSGDDLLLPLLAGDVDAIAAPVATLYHQIGRIGLGGRIEQSQVNLNQFPAGFLVDRTQTGLLQDMNSAIAHAKTQANIQALYDDWFRPKPDPLTPRESTVVLIAFGTVVVALLYWGWLHYGVRKRAKLATERANSLQEVLNATGATLLIADKEMRPIWWNEAYAQHFPEQVQSLNKGTTLRAVISARAKELTTRGVLGDVVQQKCADDQILELVDSGETKSVDIVAGGKVLESRGVKLSSGQFGLVATDVTALTVAHKELQSNAERLMEANRDLSEFSHVAAHDLAGPLRNIRDLHRWILSDIADADVKLEQEVIENFAHIDRLIGRQSALIDDLLAYASSDGQASSRPFDPKTRWASIMDLCNVPAGFTITFPEDSPKVFADPVGFEIVLRNLISNAIKHHDKKVGQIVVSNQIDGDVARVSVTDDGPGIQKKYLDMIFQPFKTLKSRDRGGGTGLGLAFVERTVGKWGGRVNVSSNPAIRETSFSFTVPLANQTEGQENVVQLRVG